MVYFSFNTRNEKWLHLYDGVAVITEQTKSHETDHNHKENMRAYERRLTIDDM